MTTTPRLARRSDLVRAVPHILGHVPHDSLVCVVLLTDTPGRPRLGPVLRIDFDFRIAGGLDGDELGPMLDLVGSVDGIDAVAPVLFTSEIGRSLGLDGGAGNPLVFDHFSDAVLMVAEVLRDSGLRVLDPIWADEANLGSLLDPADVQELPEAGTAAIEAQLVFDGSSYHSDFGSAVSLPSPDPRVLREYRDLQARVRLDRPAEDLVGFAVAAALADARRRFVDLVSPAGSAGPLRRGTGPWDAVGPATHTEDAAPDLGMPDATAVFGYQVLLRDPRTRDGLLLFLSGIDPELCPGDRQPVDLATFVAASADHLASLGMFFEIGGVSPDLPHLGRVVALLIGVRTHVEREESAAVYGALAWFEWLRMRMSFARHYAARALEIDPGYRLAQLMDHATFHTIPPGWIREKVTKGRRAG